MNRFWLRTGRVSFTSAAIRLSLVFLLTIGLAGALIFVRSQSLSLVGDAVSDSAADAEGLISWWKLDEGQGTVATDSGRSQLDGELIGEPPPEWNTNATGSACLRLAGGAGAVVAGAEGGLPELREAVTVMAWVKRGAYGDGTILDTWVSDDLSGNMALFLADGHPAFEVMIGAGQVLVFGETQLEEDEWHHVAGVFDGQNLTVYVDGELDGSTRAVGQLVPVDQAVMLGQGVAGWGMWGALADVRIYGTALNERSIADKLGELPPSDADLVSEETKSGSSSGAAPSTPALSNPLGGEVGGSMETNDFQMFSLLSGCPQTILASNVTNSIVDDYTEHTYSVSGLTVGQFADCTVQRYFPRPIKSVRVTIVSGQADDIGYVGTVQVTAIGDCSTLGMVQTPVDVSSQLSVSSNSVSLLLRAKENCCCQTGWGPDTAAGRPPARLHWEVTFDGDNNDPCSSGSLVLGGSCSASGGLATGSGQTAADFDPAQSEDGNQITSQRDGVSTGRGGSMLQDQDVSPVRQPGNSRAATLAFGRSQVSDSKLTGPLGRGWTHNYNVSVTDGSNQVTVTDWTGSPRLFLLTNGTYVGEPGTTLTKAGSNLVWKLTHGTTYTFDAANGHRLASITDRLSNVVTLAYNPTGLLTQVTDVAGRKLSLHYDGTNRLWRVIDPVGRTTSFAYTTNSLLSTVTDAIGIKARYEYLDAVNSNAVTRYTNPNNTIHTYAFGANGKAASDTTADGRKQSYVHDGAALRIVVTNRLGSLETYFNNGVGAVTAIVDHAGSRQFGRDANQRMVSYRDRLGNLTQYFYETNSCACSGGSKLERVIDALGRTNRWGWKPDFDKPYGFTDAAGKQTTWVYDNRGNITNEVNATGGVTRFGYDGAGNLLLAVAPNNVTNRYAYDSFGNCTNVTDGLGNQVAFTYDAVGRLLSRTDALNRSDQFLWDVRDRLVRSINGAGGTNVWVYDGSGDVVAWTNALGMARVVNYDSQNRPAFVYLPDGTLAREIWYDAAGNTLTVFDALGNYESFTRDALGRLTGYGDKLLNLWTYQLDAEGRRTRVIDPNIHTNSFTYDAVGRVTAWTDGRGKTANFRYDAVGSLTNVTDAKGNALNFRYDAARQLTNLNYAGVSAEQFRYDAAGNLTGFVNRASQPVRLTYDGANRLTQKDYVGTNDVIAFRYDAASQLTGIVWTAGANVTNSALRFFYDGIGRLTNEIQTVGQASSLSIGYQYYADGRRRRLTYPDGTFLTYEYNSNGWLTAIKDGGTNVIVSYEYDAAGRRTKRNLENATFTVYEYDAADQLTNLWHRQIAGTTNTISQYLYGYDPAGNRKWVKRAHQANKGDVYQYDAADQISTVFYNATNPDATPSGWDRQDTLTYDNAGNRSSVQTIRTYNLGLNYATSVNNLNQYLGPLWGSESVSLTGAVFRVDDCSGTTAYDWVSFLNATLQNGTGWTNGIYGCAVRFDGVNDQITFGDKNGLEGWSNLTFAAWIRPNAFVTTRNTQLIGKLNVYSFGFLAATPRQLSLRVGNGSSYQAATTSATLLPSNRWTHVAVTYTNGTVRFYVNGELTDTISQTYTMGQNSQPVLFSRSTEAFNGWMDDIRLYPAAFPPHEIRALTGMRNYSYDAKGNLTSDRVWDYAYDHENRLTSAATASGNALRIDYRYDALGRQIERRTSGQSLTTNRYYYAGWQLIAEYNGSGALQRKYVYGPGIDEPVRMTASSTKYFCHSDGLGSVTEVTTNGGFKVESYTYDVYGTPTMYNASAIPISQSAIGNRLLFTARDRDADTTLYNYRYRYYSPSLGRFVQPDPISLTGGMHLYRYVANQPTVAFDPFGLVDCSALQKQLRALRRQQSATLGTISELGAEISHITSLSASHRLANVLVSGVGIGRAVYGLGSALVGGVRSVSAAASARGISMLTPLVQASGQPRSVLTAAEVAAARARDATARQIGQQLGDEMLSNAGEAGFVAAAGLVAAFGDALASGSSTLDNVYRAFDEANQDADTIAIQLNKASALYKGCCL